MIYDKRAVLAASWRPGYFHEAFQREYERNAMPPYCRTNKNISSSWIGCQKTGPKDMIRKLRKQTYVPKVPSLRPSPGTKDNTTARNNHVS
jgi:hypothetical protein